MSVLFRDVVLNILPGFKFKPGQANSEVSFSDTDRLVAWEIYIDLVTRISMEPLLDDEGVEETAISALHTLFQNIRTSIQKAGPNALGSARIGIFVLNRILRPFLARWHKVISENAFDNEERVRFRDELKELQRSLRGYATSLLKLLDIKGDLELIGD